MFQVFRLVSNLLGFLWSVSSWGGISCTASFTKTLVSTGLVWDPFDFNRYERVLRDDSKARLAETGEWTGAKDIIEYLYLVQGTNPFWSTPSRSLDEFDDIEFVRFDKDEQQCVYNAKIKTPMRPNPQVVAPGTPDYTMWGMAKLYYNPDKHYITVIDFLVDPAETILSSQYVWDSDVTRQYMCDILAVECAGHLEDESQLDNCLETMSSLPMNSGPPYYNIDENSQGCRYQVHAPMAVGNPSLHCAHLSLIPQADPKGKVKCQDGSSLGVKPGDLFSAAEIESYFQWKGDMFDCDGVDAPYCEGSR